MNLPKYLKIKNEIKDAIIEGKFQPGEKIYSENEISQKYGVSNTTAVRAIQELVNEGYLARQQGVGTFVRKALVNKEVLIKEIVFPPHHTEKKDETTRVISVNVIRNQEIAEKLQIDESEEIIHFLRVRYMNGAPWNVQNTYIARKNLPNLSLEEPTQFESLSKAIKNSTGIDTLNESMIERLSVLFPVPTTIKEQLELADDVPVYRIERVTFHPENHPFEYVETFIHSEYYSLEIKRLKK